MGALILLYQCVQLASDLEARKRLFRRQRKTFSRVIVNSGKNAISMEIDP